MTRRGIRTYDPLECIRPSCHVVTFKLQTIIYVCMYVCINVYMYVCMYVCMYMYSDYFFSARSESGPDFLSPPPPPILRSRNQSSDPLEKQTRIARWYAYFRTKNPNLGKFRRICNVRCWYTYVFYVPILIVYILLPFWYILM
jgi:hypothetical protein